MTTLAEWAAIDHDPRITVSTSGSWLDAEPGDDS